MNQKNACLFIMILTLTLTNLVGCSSQLSAKNSINNSNKLLEQKIQSYILKKDPSFGIKNFRIVSTYSISNGMLVMSLFDNGSKPFEGFFQTQHDKSNKIEEVISGDFTESDTSAAFSHHEMSGDASIKGEQKQTYLIVGGIITDKEIKSMNITFNDGKFVNLKLSNDDNFFSYARTDKFVSVKSIEALDKDDNVIYTYPPYPPLRK